MFEEVGDLGIGEIGRFLVLIYRLNLSLSHKTAPTGLEIDDSQPFRTNYV
jgi:hypothetical protein